MATSNLIQHLQTIGKMYEQKSDTFRSITFYKAATSIGEYHGDYISDFNEVKIAGIGPSTLKVIGQFINLGTSDRYEQLIVETKDTHTDRVPDIKDLTSIPGINIIQAVKLSKTYDIINQREFAIALDKGLLDDTEFELYKGSIMEVNDG